MATNKKRTLADIRAAQGEGVAQAQSQREWEEQRAQARADTFTLVSLNIGALGPTFATSLDQMARQIHSAMAAQGFWNGEAGSTGTKIALMHSELSEALEADRKDIKSDDKIPEFSGLEAELADTIIRILDFAGAHGLRLGAALVEKMQVNLQREFMHGKKY